MIANHVRTDQHGVVLRVRSCVAANLTRFAGSSISDPPLCAKIAVFLEPDEGGHGREPGPNRIMTCMNNGKHGLIYDRFTKIAVQIRFSHSLVMHFLLPKSILLSHRQESLFLHFRNNLCKSFEQYFRHCDTMTALAEVFPLQSEIGRHCFAKKCLNFGQIPATVSATAAD